MAAKKTQLTPADSFRMQLGRLDLERERERARAARAERAARRVGAELALAKAALAQAQTELAVLREDQRDAERLADAEESHRLLAEDIGKRYGVDWKTTGFDPDTGLLLPLPED